MYGELFSEQSKRLSGLPMQDFSLEMFIIALLVFSNNPEIHRLKVSAPDVHFVSILVCIFFSCPEQL